MNVKSKKRGDLIREKILLCIINHIQEKGYAPTVRELCEMTGLKSTSSIHAHLRTMTNNGLIVAEIDKPRAIRVIGYKFVKENENELQSSN